MILLFFPSVILHTYKGLVIYYNGVDMAGNKKQNSTPSKVVLISPLLYAYHHSLFFIHFIGFPRPGLWTATGPGATLLAVSVTAYRLVYGYEWISQ